MIEVDKVIKKENLISIDEALELNRETIKKIYNTNVNPALGNLLALLNFDKKYTRAQGTQVWDEKGNSYLDFLGGYGSLNLGHNHQAVIEAIDKVKSLPNILQASINPLAAALAHNLAQITPGELSNVFFGNSGAEAVEGALKTAKIYTGKRKIIYCEGSFHGKTTGALSVTGRVKYQKPFYPLIPQCEPVPFGDLEALERALKDKDTACFIVEPIQGEGGIILPPEGYLKAARELCTKYEALFIVDEVQTGFGRTGKMFASEWDGIAPDIMCFAKALGGGIMPIGAFITTKEIWEKSYGSTDRATLHTSTFGGNSWAAAAALATLEVLLDGDLAYEAREKGNYLLERLAQLKSQYALIKDVRGKGLLIGIEFQQEQSVLDKLTGGKVSELTKEYTGALVAGELLNKHNIITAYTINNPNVIRLEPPLTVTYEELDYVINSLNKTFSSNKSVIKLALSSSKSIIGSLLKK
ncbi:aspartate aminotransferase family protein [Desulfitibacter alkalitolerans]|uniref:aspartate aminotransferase family protein n=1 Tax=Desulfitibacter alkalitolerans TaxID=264641 RepID=UPI000487EC21